MHMLSRKDFNSAELETVRISESPTTIVTANGEVITKEEATVWPFSHSENSARITDPPTSGPVVRNHNSSKMADESKCNTANCVPIVVPGQSATLNYTYISDITIARSRNSSFKASRINKKGEYEWHRKEHGETRLVDQQKPNTHKNGDNDRTEKPVA